MLSSRALVLSIPALLLILAVPACVATTGARESTTGSATRSDAGGAAVPDEVSAPSSFAPGTPRDGAATNDPDEPSDTDAAVAALGESDAEAEATATAADPTNDTDDTSDTGDVASAPVERTPEAAPAEASDGENVADRDAREEILAALEGAVGPDGQPSRGARNPRAGVAGTPLETSSVLPSGAPRPRDEGPAAVPSEAPSSSTRKFSEEEAKALENAAKEFAREVADALNAGDRELLHSRLVTDAELAAILTEGGYALLKGILIPTNDARIRELVEVTRGSVRDHSFEPGVLSRTIPENQFWKRQMPMMSNGVLRLDLSGIPQLITFNNLVYLDGKWKVFRFDSSQGSGSK